MNLRLSQKSWSLYTLLNELCSKIKSTFWTIPTLKAFRFLTALSKARAEQKAEIMGSQVLKFYQRLVIFEIRDFLQLTKVTNFFHLATGIVWVGPRPFSAFVEAVWWCKSRPEIITIFRLLQVKEDFSEWKSRLR